MLRRLAAWFRRLFAGRGDAPDDRYPMF
jgi:hypothetical protein